MRREQSACWVLAASLGPSLPFLSFSKGGTGHAWRANALHSTKCSLQLLALQRAARSISLQLLIY
jgi:hypothetical protein